MKTLLLTLTLFFGCMLLSVSGSAQETGTASYYADALKGRKMASGVRYDPEEYICAHRTLPFGTIVKISRKDRPEHSVMATVSDRGPFVRGRVVDVSKRAARELNLINKGVAEVVVSVIKLPDGVEESYASGL